MNINFNIDLTNKSDFDLSFTVDSGNITWYLNDVKKADELINEAFKNQIPKNTIFKISSLIYNVETQERETNVVLDSWYNMENNNNILDNSLIVLVKDDISPNHLTKEVMMTLFQFSQKVAIDRIFLLLSVTNANYILLLQQMMTCGFETFQELKSTTIDDVVYKILKVEIKDISGNIEEIEF